MISTTVIFCSDNSSPLTKPLQNCTTTSKTLTKENIACAAAKPETRAAKTITCSSARPETLTTETITPRRSLLFTTATATAASTLLFTRSSGAVAGMIGISPASGAKFEFRVDRTPKSLQKKEDAEKEEVLLLEGVNVSVFELAQFVVFVNLPQADENTPTYIAEYAGCFYSIGPVGRSRNIRLGISDNLKRLGIAELPQILVTVVARGFGLGNPPLTVNRVLIEYD